MFFQLLVIRVANAYRLRGGLVVLFVSNTTMLKIEHVCMEAQ